MMERATLIATNTIRLERLLPGPVERAWSYLVDSDKRAMWFAGGEFDLRVGGRIELRFAHDRLSAEKEVPEKHKGVIGMRFEGRITRLEPMRLLAYSWDMGGGPTEVTFELRPRGKDVLLVITHQLTDNRAQHVNIAGGWDAHSGILADVLNGIEPRPFWTTHARLEKEYEAAL